MALTLEEMPIVARPLKAGTNATKSLPATVSEAGIWPIVPMGTNFHGIAIGRGHQCIRFRRDEPRPSKLRQ
jgi:hypothetical protein